MSDHGRPPSAAESSRPPVVEARILLAPRPDGAEDIWSVLVALATTLQPTEWCLIGGQMVAFRASIAGVPAPRTSDDLDVLSNLHLHPDAVARCARTVRALGFEAEQLHSTGHRFTGGRLVVDALAPDHPPRTAALRTVGRRTTVEVPGGTQALQRLELVPVEYAGREVLVPIPDLLGAPLLKADATRLHDPDRHLLDVAFLTSLVTDPRDARRTHRVGPAKVTRIPDGAHRVFLTFGTDWDAAGRLFTRTCAFQRFDRTASFRTRATTYSINRLSTTPVLNGNATVSEVDPDDFPTG